MRRLATPLFASCVLACALAGCAHPDALHVGMTRDEIDHRLGKPAAMRHDPDGDVLIYSSQPFGEEVKAAHLDASGRIVRVESLMNIAHFAEVEVGTWTRQDVLDHFGPPGDISGTRQYLVWAYSYREAQEFHLLFYIMFDAAGVVRQTQTAPNPLYEGDGRGAL